MVKVIDNTFVIHVSEGYEERRQHIDKHLPERGINNFTYRLDGDITDFSEDILDAHFIWRGTGFVIPPKIHTGYK